MFPCRPSLFDVCQSNVSVMCRPSYVFVLAEYRCPSRFSIQLRCNSELKRTTDKGCDVAEYTAHA